MNEYAIESAVWEELNEFKPKYGMLNVSNVDVNVYDDEEVIVELYGTYRMRLYDLMNAEKEGSSNAVEDAFFEAQDAMYDYGDSSSEFNKSIDEQWKNIEKKEKALTEETMGTELFNAIYELESDLKNSVSYGEIKFVINFGYINCEVMDFNKNSFKNLVLDNS